jgi:hypothetical protein
MKYLDEQMLLIMEESYRKLDSFPFKWWRS